MRDKIMKCPGTHCRGKTYIVSFVLYTVLYFVFITPSLYSQESAAPENNTQAKNSTTTENNAQAKSTTTTENNAQTNNGAAAENNSQASNEAITWEEEEYDFIMENQRGLTFTAPKDTPEHITQDEMEREGANDLWEAVRNVPGVVINGGGRRNDSNFSVRGYGADAVPIYVDGIEMANPYRGESDAARFLTGDLESIDISKGYSSELLGANALGGLVLMHTAKPKEKMEFSWKNSIGFDSIMKFADWTTVASAGTKQDLFYGKAVFQYRDVDHFRLPDSFEPTAYNPQQKGDRLWSDSKDYKLTLIAGLTPIDYLDVWATYVYQKADKGFSPPEIRTREYSIWEWPRWDRHSISLNSVFNNNIFAIEGLLYFDKYDNTLIEYYTKWKAYQLGLHEPPSDYDEYTFGARVTGAWFINDWNTLKAAVTYKKEDHKGLDDGELGVHVQEDIISAGVEHSITPIKNLTFRAGAGIDTLLPLDFWGSENELMKLMKIGYYIIKTRNMLLYTWQAGVFYKIVDGHELRLTYARKNHFPTMSDRYSTRFGQRLPNSNLGPEIANHFELGYRGYWFNLITINTSVYFSLMNGKIVNIKIPNPEYPASNVDYARNLDSVSFYGYELAPELEFGDWFSFGAAFSLNKYHIWDTFLGVKAIDNYPEITFSSYIVFTPTEIEAVGNLFSTMPVIKYIRQISLVPRVEYTSARAADTAESFILCDYFLAHIKLNINVTKYFSISLGVENIFDTYYEIRENFPLAGRTYNVTVTAKY